jgi:hypothetical protein
MKRSIVIKEKSGETRELVLSKAVLIKEDISMLHLDKLPDGTWRLIFSKDITDDFSKISSFEIFRSDE